MRIDHGTMDGASGGGSAGADAGILPQGASAQVPEIAAEAAMWAGFASPRSANEFCESWLSLQCRFLAGAARGVLLLREDGGRFTPAAVWPDRRTDVTHLAAAAQDALARQSGAVTTKDGSAQVAYPIEVSGIIQGVVVIEFASARPDQLTAALRHLHWGAGWLETLFHRRSGQMAQLQLSRNDLTLDMLARADPPRLNWSTLKHVFWQRGGYGPSRESVTNAKRLSRSEGRGRLMSWCRWVNPSRMPFVRSA